MDPLLPSLQRLLDPLASAFRSEVFALFRRMVAAWVVCLGWRTISRVWETTGQADERNHAAAFRLFSQAAWNWDEVCRWFLLQVVARLVPGTRLWVVVDDTWCHKRGAKVAFGGIFLDAVLSTKRHNVLRSGTNGVLRGVLVALTCRPGRYFCLPILWRVYQKQGATAEHEHRTKRQLAAEMLAVLAGWLPRRQILAVADRAYLGKPLLRERPANVDGLGPSHGKAGLYEALAEPQGRRRHGGRWPTPQEMLADDVRRPRREQTITFKSGRERASEVKVITGCGWYAAAGPQAVQGGRVRDPHGQWRDEALVSTDATLPAAAVITGSCRRWHVEVAFCGAEQRLGFHDPQVRCAAAVQRATPMAWFVGTLVVCWYVEAGQHGEQAQRHRPWYTHKETPTFADMLAACRLRLWQEWLQAESGVEQSGKRIWPGCWNMLPPAPESNRFSREILVNQ